jgi:prevent-host-death family protein
MTHDGKETQTVTAFDAKNRLGRLLDRVQSGEELVITRHGEPVAWLVPFEKRAGERVKAALEVFRKVRESLHAAGEKITQEEIRTWRDEGRR